MNSAEGSVWHGLFPCCSKLFLCCQTNSLAIRLYPYQFWSRDYKLAPYKAHNFHCAQYIPTEHRKKAFQFLPLIPDDAMVSAGHFFLPYLYKKKP